MALNPILKEERNKLSATVKLIKSDKVVLEKTMDELGAFNLEKLKEIRENPATNAADFFQFLQMLDKKNVAFNVPDKYRKLEELSFLEKAPYFSRIDLSDPKEGVSKPYYIGKFGFSYDKQPVVIDWRAKIASIYYKYRYPQKNVVYYTPKGKQTRDLTLKRTYDIDDGKLVKYYNNDIKLDENEIIVEKIEERTGGVLEDIVETIQKSQLEIIESDPRRVCIVQGTVGSGKSTVAIHKLSYIFFNYPELIRPERSILIAKNQILVSYLSTLFPKLGIFNINYGTLRDIIYKLFFLESIPVEYDLDKNKELSEINIKKINELKSDLDAIHVKYSNMLVQLFSSQENETFGGFVYDSAQPVRRNLTEAIQDLEEEHKFQKDFIKENPNSPRTQLFQENVKIMRKIIRKLSTIRSSIRTDALKKISRKYKINPKDLGYKEALLYIYIFNELVGFSKFEKYEYCVVDEGQDFSLLEYMVLDKLVQNGRFCILGDLNQAYSNDGLNNWEEISSIIHSAKDAANFELDTNYRNTKPIIDYANQLLSGYTSSYLPKSIHRRGKDPVIETVSSNNDLWKKFSKDLKKETKSLNKSIGIICFGKEYFEKASTILKELNIKDDKIIELRENSKINYLPKAVYLTEFENCKGLEFGKVYILGLNLSKIKTFNDAKKAFVAVTRAMNELHIYEKN